MSYRLSYKDDRRPSKRDKERDRDDFDRPRRRPERASGSQPRRKSRSRSRSPQRDSRRSRDHRDDGDSYRRPRDERERSPSRPTKDKDVKDQPPAPSTSLPPRRPPASAPTSLAMIEVIANDRLGGKVRVKCSPDDTIGDLKKLIAAQKGTKPEKIVLKKWYTIFKDHIKLSDYEIHNGMSLEMN